MRESFGSCRQKFSSQFNPFLCVVDGLKWLAGAIAVELLKFDLITMETARKMFFCSHRIPRVSATLVA
jgi:hypothetical protein